MKDRLDFSIIKALLKKQFIEETYAYKKGHFDIVGFILRLLIVAAFVTVFVIFFGKFVSIYVAIKADGALNVSLRVSELLTIVYTALIVAMTIGAIGQINKQIFGADDVKTFAAMPVPTKSLFVAKLVFIYGSQLILSIITVLAINLTIGAQVDMEGSFYVATALTCILLPLIAIAIASILSLPFNLIKRTLNKHFVINFIVITLVTALLFYLYTVLLSAVKEMLIGESNLRYFFNESVMLGIAAACKFLYPAKWMANIFLGQEMLISIICIVAVLVACLAVSMTMIRVILTGALQSRMSGSTQFIKAESKMSKQTSSFLSLVKKEFFMIFRTPSYMFSYFSIAVIMPLMVYSCMSIGSSLVVKLVGINCDLELALFLTLLFGALTNMFCATNISRDGAMFYSVKALPLSCKSVFFSKVFLCMAVTLVSQLASAILLFATGYASWYVALIVFAVGTVFSFVHICIATRYDFNHARFSTEEDGEIKESSSIVSVIVLLGLVISFIVGGAVFVSRILLLLRGTDFAYLSYLIAGVASIMFGLLSYWYFIHKLEKKYYEFDRGGI